MKIQIFWASIKKMLKTMNKFILLCNEDVQLTVTN